MSAWDAGKQAVLEAAKRMSERGFVVGTSGNISMRLEDSKGRDLAAITPTNLCYDTMCVGDIEIVDFEGQPIEGEHAPSVETMLHLGIYKARRKVNAVVHTHPVFASILAVTGIEIPPILDDQVTYLGGAIKVAEYSLPGSKELVTHVLPALGPRNAVILANHGALAVGRDIAEAFTHCEMLEKTARIFIHALSLGKVNPVPAAALEMEQAYFTYLFGDS